MYLGEPSSHKDRSGARLVVCAMESQDVSIDVKLGDRNLYMLTYPVADARALRDSLSAAIQAADLDDSRSDLALAAHARR